MWLFHIQSAVIELLMVKWAEQSVGFGGVTCRLLFFDNRSRRNGAPNKPSALLFLAKLVFAAPALTSPQTRFNRRVIVEKVSEFTEDDVR